MSDSVGNRRELMSELTDLERRAVLATLAYAGNVNQGRARSALPFWQHFKDLSADEMLAVIEMFPPDDQPSAPVEPVDTGTHWVDLGTGPGYVPGEGRS